jgi:hypothetical protein
LSQRKTLQIFILFLALASLLAACSSGSPENKPVQIVATPAGDIELVEVFATHDPTLLSSGTPIPNNFPPGLDKIYLGIKFKKHGPDVSQLKMNYELTYKGVPLETELESHPYTWTEETSGSEVVALPVRMVDGSAFGDGQYQAKILIDGQLIALLNFTLGGTPTAP